MVDRLSAIVTLRSPLVLFHSASSLCHSFGHLDCAAILRFSLLAMASQLIPLAVLLVSPWSGIININTKVPSYFSGTSLALAVADDTTGLNRCFDTNGDTTAPSQFSRRDVAGNRTPEAGVSRTVIRRQSSPRLQSVNAALPMRIISSYSGKRNSTSAPPANIRRGCAIDAYRSDTETRRHRAWHRYYLKGYDCNGRSRRNASRHRTAPAFAGIFLLRTADLWSGDNRKS